MYIFSPYGRTSCDYILDVTILSWFYDPLSDYKISLGIRSVSPSDQSPRCPHEETLGPYLPIVKFCGVSPRNFAEKTLGEINDFYFSPRKKKKKKISQGVFRGETRKKSFLLGLICSIIPILAISKI